MIQEAAYTLTPKGIILCNTHVEDLAKRIMDSLELAAHRRGCNALLINTKGWEFINVETKS